MTVAVAKAMYERQIANGEIIQIERSNPNNAPKTVVSVRARVMGYTPEELIAGMDQGDRKVLVLADDLEGSAITLPLKQNSTDRVVIRGRRMMISEVDDSTRRLQGTLIAYEIRATG